MWLWIFIQVNNKLDTCPVVDIWPAVALECARAGLSVSFDVYGFSTTKSHIHTHAHTHIIIIHSCIHTQTWIHTYTHTHTHTHYYVNKHKRWFTIFSKPTDMQEKNSSWDWWYKDLGSSIMFFINQIVFSTINKKTVHSLFYRILSVCISHVQTCGNVQFHCMSG